MQSDTAMRNKNGSLNQQAVIRRSHPAKTGEDRFGPPTLERSGSEHRRAVTSLALLERARAWEWVKDPPAGEGQVGHKQYRVGRLHTNRCCNEKESVRSVWEIRTRIKNSSKNLVVSQKNLIFAQ